MHNRLHGRRRRLLGGLAACVAVSTLLAAAAVFSITGGPQRRLEGRLINAAGIQGGAAFTPGASATATGADGAAAGLQLERLGHHLEAAVKQKVFCDEAFPLAEDIPVRAFGSKHPKTRKWYEKRKKGVPESEPGVAGMMGMQLRANVTLFLYSGQDAVSYDIRKGHRWEAGSLDEILWALKQPLPQGALQQQQQPLLLGPDNAAAGGSIVAPSSPQPPLFVDVGANVGWFAVHAAAEGYRVAAFEGMASNVRLIRSSVCASPGLAGRLRLYAFGLGAKRDKCYIFSDVRNRGDGFTMCGAESYEHAASKVPAGCALRGTMSLERLDEVIKEDIKVLKIDVEGYEPVVLQGATGLMQAGAGAAGQARPRVWYIHFEFNTHLLVQSPAKLLEDLQAYGYRLSTKGFRGPWLTPAQLADLSKEMQNINMYAAHSELFKAAGESQAAARGLLGGGG